MRNSVRPYLRSLPSRLLARTMRNTVVDAFHYLAYDRRAHSRHDQRFMGQTVDQWAGDLLVYHELIYRERPAFILQTGVWQGGSVLFFCHMLDLIQAPVSAVVIGIDLHLTDAAKALRHPRVRLIEGSSISPEVVSQATALMPSAYGLIVLDSDHSKAHVSRELACYAKFTGPGTHLVVEDTNINGRPVFPTFGDGPAEAVAEFVAINPDFGVNDDVWADKLFSWHQGGWLRRQGTAAT